MLTANATLADPCLAPLDEWVPSEGAKSERGRTNYSLAELRTVAAKCASREGGKLMRWSISIGNGDASLHIAYVKSGKIHYLNHSI